MREWAEQKGELEHKYIGICSDTRAGNNDEDASLLELEIPVTTDLEKVSSALRGACAPEVMTVVFCTYHSLGLIEQAQDDGAPPFDLVICDEAHRTTGIERPDDQTSPFVLVHDKRRIRARKRLYMTATPRLYTEGARAQAARHNVDVFSMDDEDVYGPEFHGLPFSRAIEQDLLSDYKVVVLTVSESHASQELQAYLATDGNEINLTDAAKIVGCWRALQNPEGREPSDEIRPLRRAIAFTNTIRLSKRLEKHWSEVVDQAATQLSEVEYESSFICDIKHVDGKNHALERKSKIEWLKGSGDGACRILSNARCLSEGIDVPALDAVLFINPRHSQVDVVQAVGRVMRKSKGKNYGYIILPIAIPPGMDPAVALDDNKRFAPVWDVLRALRSHDDRFDAEINQIDLNKNPTNRIIFGGGNGNGQISGLPFPPIDLPPAVIFAKIVDRCGDRKYWENWAEDVADIFSRLVDRIKRLLENSESLREWFTAFHEELKVSINESITTDSAIGMMAQHILTRPVFEALFESYDFAKKNPVARSLDMLRGDFGEFGLENETRDLERFYESVRRRARGLDNSAARQSVLMDLYEHFFAKAMKKDAERLGIVYTPVEVVDFILTSADKVLRDEFRCKLSDEGIRVLDPFTGTGIFLVRLLQTELIKDADLRRKYQKELHANEIILLAYYIAAIHIEEAFHGRIGDEDVYEPFNGIVLTDTFNLHTQRKGFPKDWLPENSKRAERQQKSPIQVIVGNPPWSAGQKNAADDNPNVDYPEMKRRIAETYVNSTDTSQNKNRLYDTYKMAIRWASDRISERGIVAFVTNGSYIHSNVDSGVRACLAEEFTSIYVLNLRGNARVQGERRRSEGDNIFGQGSRASVAIMVLVKNPNAAYEGCRILYRDIGDYLTREDKLKKLRDWQSTFGIEYWEVIVPDRHNDWVGKRNEDFQKLCPIGSGVVKAGKTDDAIFRLFSNGLKTGRDAWIYNFSRRACAANAKAMIKDYRNALRDRNKTLQMSGGGPDVRLDASALGDIVKRHSVHIRWDPGLKTTLKNGGPISYSEAKIWKTQYRPFVKQNCYVEYSLVQRKYRMANIFPSSETENRAICVPGIGSSSPFSALMVNAMPDLGLISACQCFPRYRFDQALAKQARNCVDNITDTSLRFFRDHYGDDAIDKDMIFDYVYGVLHAPEYRECFINDLVKELPRIPFAPNFHAFAKAGNQLAELHLNYETCQEYPLQVTREGERGFSLGEHTMKLDGPDRTTLVVNDHLRLSGIPAEAHLYQVNGRTPLEWFVDRYRVTQDKKSGIVNDPNGWFDSMEEFIASVQRIVHVSVETSRIVASLPEPFGDSDTYESVFGAGE